MKVELFHVEYKCNTLEQGFSAIWQYYLWSIGQILSMPTHVVSTNNIWNRRARTEVNIGGRPTECEHSSVTYRYWHLISHCFCSVFIIFFFFFHFYSLHILFFVVQFAACVVLLFDLIYNNNSIWINRYISIVDGNLCLYRVFCFTCHLNKL